MADVGLRLDVEKSGIQFSVDGVWLPLVLCAVLASCSTFQSAQSSTSSHGQLTPDMRISRVLVSEGLQKLHGHHYEDASRIFNAGLKYDPDNAQIHFLNGLTYHLIYLRGDDAAKDLAATGYKMALGIEPAHFQAALQLGRLENEMKRFNEAVAAFRRAADIEPTSGDVQLGLAMAAYHAHDLVTARTAIERYASLHTKSAVATRVEAMVYAGLGEQGLAQQAAARYADLETDVGEIRQVSHRVNQWGAWHAALPALEMNGAAKVGQEGIRMAQGGPPEYIYGSGAQPANSAYPMPQTMAGTGGQFSAENDPVIPPWDACDKTAARSVYSSASTGSYSYNGGATSSADETAPLPALPVPCKGAGNPRMAILDVTIVRTEDIKSTSNGINLLNGLTYVFGRSRQVTDVLTSATGAAETRTITRTRQNNDGLSNPTTQGGIAYALNIANATNSRSEVLAQPSLVALDRQPSTFFSGRNITLGIAAQTGGSGSFADKPIGVSLSVTPTFTADDSMLVSVRAARAFVEQVDSNVSFGQSMQTTRNAVTANVVLKFGQTLILSGLAEQELQQSSDGVPVLQDIPALQYLFRHKTTQNYTRSVLVLMTPRKPELERDGLPPGLNRAYQRALDNKLFLQFRSGDLRGERWDAPSRLDNLLEQIKNSIYF
jgi:tetratricopeptide (TPR) repeat protein